MTKVRIDFFSSDASMKSQLCFDLYPHNVSQKWKQLVMKLAWLGVKYKTKDIFYGGNFNSVDEIITDLNDTVDFLKTKFQSTWSHNIFDPIRDRKVRALQKDLNIAHVFFEKVIKNQFPEETEVLFSDQLAAEKLGHLNYCVHYIESKISNMEGFFLDFQFGPPYIKIDLQESDVQLFTPNKVWGEMYLAYPHVGENILEAFQNNYPGNPTLQTQMAGNFVLNFQPDTKFERFEELGRWVKDKLGDGVFLEKLPIGLIPLGRISEEHKEWGPDTFESFFQAYPMIGRLNFEENPGEAN